MPQTSLCMSSRINNSLIVPIANCSASVLRSINSSGELIGAHYVDRQHAQTRWASWTAEMSRLDICEAVRSSD